MKMIKFVLLLVLTMFSLSTWADDVSVELSPPEPIVNENFYLTFKIKSTGSVDPDINFTPSGASVLGKTEQGVSISTIVINGKFTTTREQNYVYELVAERAGQVSLKNIKVVINGKTTVLKDIYTNVLSQPRRVPDAFMEAQASKTRVYLGEGIDVNYYLYFKTSISANDVKEFPKLNKFIKRFHHINSPVETVQYKGQVLKRILAYSARLYPEKVGMAVLDPMTISVQIVENDYNNPYGGFGFGTQRFKNKELSSPRIEVEVLPLPPENVPAGFTGMVGEHEFSLLMPKSKYLVNEPIEVKLEVKGKGALENMEAPVLFSDNNLEQFDTKTEVSELSNSSAKKVFEYTLLARAPLSLKARELTLAYFDPASARYIEKKISIPALTVEGAAAPSTSSTPNGTKATKNDTSSEGASSDNFLNRWLAPSKDSGKAKVENTIGLVGPWLESHRSLSDYWIEITNLIILLIILSTLGLWHRQSQKVEEVSGVISQETKKAIAQLKSKGMNYSDLYRVLANLDKNNRMSLGGISIQQVIDESEMSAEAKAYFKSALIICEERTFGVIKQDKKIVFENKFFKEVLKNI